MFPYLILFFCLLVMGVVIIFEGSQIASLFFGAPFVPTPRKIVQKMIALAHIGPDDIAIDLGSGDGRVTMAAAEAGARRALGFEIQPLLVLYSQWKARRKGLRGRAIFINGSFWKTDLSKVTVVFLYQLPNVMEKLEQKLLRELPSGARVISHGFVFKTWQPEKTDGKVRLYRKR